MRYEVDVTRNHPQRGPEVVGKLRFDEVIDFYINEGMKFVMIPVIEDNKMMGFDLTAWPEQFEMKDDF